MDRQGVRASWVRRAGARRRLAAAGILVLAGSALAGCEGETLFQEGEPGGPAPRVEIRSPVDGQQVLAGRPVSVRVFAADPTGVVRVELEYAGVVQGEIVRSFSPGRDSVVVDTTIAIPGGLTGTLDLRASARNTVGLVGQSARVRLQVLGTVPTVALAVGTAPRMEMTDTLRFTVTGRATAGSSALARLGITALLLRPSRADTLLLRASQTFSPPRTGTIVQEFAFAPPSFVDSLALPDTVVLEVHAFAADTAGRCTAAVQPDEQALACGTFRGEPVALNVQGFRTRIVFVTGRTVALPDRGVIADAAVDTLRRRLYLSNFSANRIEVFDLVTSAFQRPGILVGAQPWGLALNRRQDTLMVANSGGTNISFVALGTGATREDAARRLHTPNATLHQVRVDVDQLGRVRYMSFFYDFSDRPQFIAQDSTGRILYSTVPTQAARSGTIRFVDPDPNRAATTDRPEVRLLFNDLAVVPSPDVLAIGHIDSLRVFAIAGSHDRIQLYDHRPGYPDSLIQSDVAAIDSAIAQLRARGSDIYAVRGVWDLDRIGFSDTTFVAASGDRAYVAFGEGARSPAGRLVLWNAAIQDISNEITIADLVSNASERISGVGLNRNGSLGILRGLQGAYFFTNDLRLQGRFTPGLETGGAGATLHPAHSDPFASDGTSLAVAGTARNSIKVIHTFHFIELGEIHIRDNVVGPLRAVLPLPADNQGRSCPGDPNCIVIKLYGVTSAGGVVVANVRAKDLRLPAGPARAR